MDYINRGKQEMKIRLLAISCLLLPISSNADSTLRAADLEKICISPAEDDRSICSLIVKAYKDGFIEGVANGAMGTYKNDPEVWQTVKDVKAKSLAPRLSKVVEQSTCIQSVQVDDLIKAFSTYVKQNPSVQSGPYRTAMFRTIETTYCKR